MMLTDTGPPVGVINAADQQHTRCIAALMEQYRDLPMDLGDASLVALAESAGWWRVLTVDRQFYVYRLGDGGALEVLP